MDIILMKRLLVYLGDIKDPWYCLDRFHMDLLNHVKGQEKEKHKSGLFQLPKDKYWHARRINYLIKSSSDLFYPVMIDNECTLGYPGQILAEPILCDGWHRFFAHIHLGYEEINAFYSGRIDVLNFLTGKTNQQP